MTRHRGSRKKVSHASEEFSQDPEASEGLSLASPALRFAPVSLFSVTADAKRKLATHKDVLNAVYELPNMGHLCGEDIFATAYFAWDTAGLWGAVQVEEPCERVSFPDVTLGNSVEVFIDTRDSKSSGFTGVCRLIFQKAVSARLDTMPAGSPPWWKRLPCWPQCGRHEAVPIAS